MAVKKGYTTVYRLAGGIPEWRSFHYPMTTSPEYAGMPAKKISTIEVEKILEEEDIFILDVRPVSFSHCNKYLQSTFHIPLIVLADNLDILPRDKKILITDSAAKQAQLAYKYLLKNGFQVIGVLRGGLEVWTSEGRPVEERIDDIETIKLINNDF